MASPSVAQESRTRPGWGGYCNHGNVLFPTWHRAYLMRVENALRSIPGCEDVTLPFWDELFDPETPVPLILTSPTFPFVGGDPNPLYSYTLQEALTHNVEEANDRYTKPPGYTTVRYPLSGLVGNEADKKETETHNKIYANESENAEILNKNVSAWLAGTVHIPDDGDPKTPIPDTFSVLGRYRLCLEAPNYTVFSNTTSQNQWIKDFWRGERHYVISLESPHNTIHLAVGGFYQKGVYNADPIIGANGDMGDNETASFDPIFYFHHCFVDYVFWKWQERHRRTAAGSLDVIPYYPGTIVPDGDGMPYLPPGTKLDMNTPLYPFRKPDQTYYSSNEVTDIVKQLGYTYGRGSLDYIHGPGFLDSEPVDRLHEIERQIVGFKRVHNVNRADYSGSFVIRTFALDSTGNKIEIGREPVLRRRDVAGCANCQNKLDVESLVPLYRGLLDALCGDRKAEEIKYSVDIHTHNSLRGGLRSGGKGPIVDDP
ncbi:hypothetical protein AAE478_009335 [Parahypoxylon ruwenzoriense]